MNDFTNQKGPMGMFGKIIKGMVSGDQEQSEEKVPDQNSPLEILKMRFAKGEISKTEFDEMKQALG